MNLFRNVILLLVLPLFLFGCDSEDVASSEPIGDIENNPIAIKIETSNAVDFSALNVTTKVDLSKNVKSSGPQTLRIKSVTPIVGDGTCNVIGIKGLTYTVETGNSQVCRFNYAIEPSSADYSGVGNGVSQVVVTDTSADKDVLTPLSFTMKNSQNNVISNLEINLSLTLPAGFSLVDSSLVITNGTDDPGSTVVDHNLITYSAPMDFEGVTIIYYTAVNDENSTEVRPGIIYITIGQGSNTAPTVKGIVILPDMVLSDTSSGYFNISVSDFVSDVDGDKLQIVDIYANGLGAILNINTLDFDYAPYLTSRQYITYVISDHHGGYSIGTLQFDVSSYKPIIYNDITFTPPMLINEVSGVFTSTYTEVGVSGTAGIYPTFSKELAKAYCTTQGLILATTQELKNIYINVLNGTSVYDSVYKWHAGMPFIGSDGSFSLYNGVSGQETEGYFTCFNVKGDANDYGFVKQVFVGKLNIATFIYASMVINGDQYFLPGNSFNLEASIVDTDPPNREASVKISIIENTVTVSQRPDTPSVFHVTVKLTDPGVLKPGSDTTMLVVGLNQCSQDASMVDMQLTGCVPIINVTANDMKITGALPNPVIEMLLDGFDIERPALLMTTETQPAYSYYNFNAMYDTYTVDELKALIGEYGDAYCDVFNANEISGRSNWTTFANTEDSWFDTLLPSNRNIQPWSGDIANRMTRWMSEATGATTIEVGQGVWLEDGTNVRQINQYSDDNRGSLQGGKPYYTNYSWQFLSCVSPYDG